jgi:hypothetical protein
MEGLLAILKAAHCRSTHHHFALDALRHLQSDSGRKLGRMLLRYHSYYLAGAKDPDTRFRDFHNHVVHVSDSHWGGAPLAAERWYQRVQQHLRERSWSEAAHAAGVLSHYFTDPLQPLHTAQSPREAIVHRPLEWSIFRSYRAIHTRWREDRFRVVFELASGTDWLAAAVLRGAELAHRAYETLVSTYDLEAARRDPRRGLSEAAIEALAELFAVAIIGWARVLDRTAGEAEVQWPHFSLAPAGLIATLNAPYRLLVKRIETQRERRAVAGLLEHYHHFGDSGPYLPDEVRLVQKVLAVRRQELEYAQSRQRARQLRSEANPALEVVLPTPQQAASGNTAPAEDLRQAASPLPVARRLTASRPIVEAPSIGPRTAARFTAIGVDTIGQFLAANPEQLVARLRVHWIDVPRIADWQAQTQLMLELPLLRVSDAQLLVGCGCRTPGLLATAEPDTLVAQLHRYATTPLGRRALRGAPPPGRSEVRAWIDAAGRAAAA